VFPSENDYSDVSQAILGLVFTSAMTASHDPQPETGQQPRALSRRKLVLAISDEARWVLLAELADGEGRMVNDLARKIGKTSSATSKHLKVLRMAGILRLRNRLHQLLERFRPAPGTREIDLGHCVVRF
jgi:DNA-binding transcriptional ArsR family regulator